MAVGDAEEGYSWWGEGVARAGREGAGGCETEGGSEEREEVQEVWGDEAGGG